MNDLFLFLVIASLVGLVVGWKNPARIKLQSQQQVGWIFGSAIILFFVLFSVTSNLKSTSNSKPAENKESQQQEVSIPSKTFEEKIIDAINVSLKPKTNTGKQRVVSVKIEKYSENMISTYKYKNGEQIVGLLITINSDENLTTNLQKGTMHNEATKIAQAVFPIDQTIGDVIIWSQLPVKDQYGNVKDDTAIVYSISRSLFTKVNWSNYNHRDLPTLLKSESSIDDRNNYYEKIKI